MKTQYVALTIVSAMISLCLGLFGIYFKIWTLEMFLWVAAACALGVIVYARFGPRY